MGSEQSRTADEEGWCEQSRSSSTAGLEQHSPPLPDGAGFTEAERVDDDMSVANSFREVGDWFASSGEGDGFGRIGGGDRFARTGGGNGFAKAGEPKNSFLPEGKSMRKLAVAPHETSNLVREPSALEQDQQQKKESKQNGVKEVREPSALEPAQHQKKEGEQAKRSNEVNKRNEAKEGVNENVRSVPSSVEVLTPAERIQKLLTRDKFDFVDIRAYSRAVENLHTDWMDVRDHLQRHDPVVCRSWKGDVVRRSDLKHMTTSEVEHILKARKQEVSVWNKKRYFVGSGMHRKQLPDVYQNILLRLPYETQEVLEEMLMKMETSDVGSQTMILRRVAKVIVENGGGLSAAVELRLDDKTLEDCNLDLAHVHMHMDLRPLASTTGPTPSQQVEIRRMKQMRDIREGKLYPEDIDDEYTRSESGSVSSKSSKDARLRTVDVYGARSFHRSEEGQDDDSKSSGGLSSAGSQGSRVKSLGRRSPHRRTPGRQSSASSYVGSEDDASVMHSIAQDVALYDPVIGIEKLFSPPKNEFEKFEQKRVKSLQALLSKHIEGTDAEQTLQDQKHKKLTGRGGTGQLLQEVLMTDAENNNFQMRHRMNSSASTKTVDVTLGQKIPSGRKTIYEYGGLDGKSSAPLIGWDGSQPFLNVFNNTAVVTRESSEKQKKYYAQK